MLILVKYAANYDTENTIIASMFYERRYLDDYSKLSLTTFVVL